LPNDIGSGTIHAMIEADPQPNGQTPEHSPFADQLHVPQFGIIHLMLWTAVTAVLLKLFMALTDESLRQFPSGQAWVFQVMQAVQVIMLASMLVGAGVLVRLRFYTMFKRLQPGHWLVLISTLEFILELAASLLFLLAGSTGLRIPPVCMFVVFTLAAAAYPFAFFQLRDARRWKVLIGAKAIGAATAVALGVASLATTHFSHWSAPSSLWVVIQYCPMLWSVAVFIVLLSAAALDLYYRTARDWVHWLGVVAHGLTSILTTAGMVYFVFFYQLPR